MFLNFTIELNVSPHKNGWIKDESFDEYLFVLLRIEELKYFELDAGKLIWKWFMDDYEVGITMKLKSF